MVNADGLEIVLFGTRQIAEGSFGRVYCARLNTPDGEKVAVKKTKAGPNVDREEELLRKLSADPHPNVVRLLHSSSDTDSLSLVMEYLPYDLGALLRAVPSDARLAVPKVQRYIFQLARALAHVHGFGFVHRDVKPANILVDPATAHLKLADFGSAKMLEVGSPSVTYITSRYYRAPEVLLDNPYYDLKIDVWAIGCILAEMLSGRILFAGADSIDQLAVIMKKRGQPPAQILSSI